MTPRPHQQQMLDGTADGWKQGFRKQLVVCPTGGGKTPFFAWVAQSFMPGRTLVLAHREELLTQARDKIKSAIGIFPEIEKAERLASRQAPIVVGSIQTLCREGRLKTWAPDHFSLVVVDEAHHALADSYRSVLGHFDGNARVLGVTATPDRGDKKSLGQYFENIAAEIPLFGLIDDGHLSPITTLALPIKIDLSTVRQTAGDFSEQDLGSALEPYLDEIAQAIKQHAGTRRTLAFLPLIATSRKFVEACRSAGLTAEHVDGESPDRKELLDRFANWEFDVLSNAMLLTEGFDDPSIDCVVVLRPTRSRPLYAQMVGRGTRIDGFKQNLLLLDFLWLHQKHSVTRPAHLIAKSEEEAEAITQLAEERSAAMPADVAEQMPLDLQSLAGAATQQREENLRKKLEEQKHKKGRFISAEEFALEHHNLEAAEFSPTMKWHEQPISEPQMKWLKKAHIDPETVRGKGHASALLGIYFSTKKLTLASAAQRAKMRQMGYPNADQATDGEARKFFADLHKSRAS